ncbi:MAG: hypothetical protein JWP97_2884 [Labilithrix sp.]|nr:hypothetical protein [Labilithrix sp.]
MKNHTAKELIATLFPEAFQSEESARSHPAREAKRLGSSAPAAAMSAVAKHAEAALPRLRKLAQARGLGSKTFGQDIGRLLSNVREYAIDRAVSHEKSYRATLGGIQHGIGVFAFLEDAAIASGDQELADFCAEWLGGRRELAGVVEHELSWFAQNPEVAMSRATSKAASNLIPART